MTEALAHSESLAASGHVPRPSLLCPCSPSAVVPDFLHRGNDGWVPLARKVGQEWQELGSVPACQLRGLFADEVIAEAIQNDGYFGLHSMYRPGRYPKKHTLLGLQPSLRNLESVRHLTCCHVDLDGYRNGLDTHDIVAAVMRLVDEGVLPPPSVFTLSRGVWAVWRLHDNLNPNAPLRSYPESVLSRWCKVQGSLHAVCAAIGSDGAAKHAATVTRIPGSTNTKNGRRVGYMLPADMHGQPFSYTLDDLEAFLRPHMPVSVVVDAIPNRPKSQNPSLSKRGLQGWHGRWHRLQQLLGQLRDMRGGWKVGTRSSALFYVAMSLRALRANEKTVRRVMTEHLEGMQQPAGDRMRLSDAMRVFFSLKKLRGHGVNHQTVADALDVSPEEAALLSAGRKKAFPPALRHRIFVLPEPPSLPQAVATQRRRDAVKKICDNLAASGTAPDGPVVEGFLLCQGITASRATVLADMRAIGCPSRRSHPSPVAGYIQAELFQHPRSAPPAKAAPSQIDF